MLRKTLLLLACAAPAALAGPVNAGTLRVGVSLPLSGPKQKSGEGLLDALRLGADELNAAGGIGGVSLELVVKDDADDPERGRQAAEELAGDPSVLAVIGHYDDAVALAARDVYDKAGVVLFAPTISNPDFTAGSPWAFSGTYSLESEAETIAAYMTAVRSFRRAYVFHSDDPYGKRLSAAFLRKARRLGLEARVSSFSEKAEKLPEDYVARRLPRPPGSDAAAVVFAHSVKGAALIRQLRAAGYSGRIFGGDRLGTDLIPMLGPDTDHVHVAFPFMYDLGTLQTADFVKRYGRRYQAEPSRFAAFAYDGLALIARALKERGPRREGVRDYLASLDSPEKAREGVSGRLWFDAQRTIPRDVIVSSIYHDAFEPAFIQLRAVAERHTLSILDQKVKEGEVIIVDGRPFFKIHVVYAGVDFYRVNQVNVPALNFELESFLWLKWTGDVDVENIGFLNEIENGTGQRVELRKNFGAPPPGTDPEVKWVSYKLKGTYAHRFDLKLFPMDTQRLTLTLAHKSKNANKVQLVVDRNEVNDNALKETPLEWRYLGREDYAGTFNYNSSFGNPTYKRGETQADFSVYRVELALKRLLFPYLVTLFLPLGVLVAISLSSFLIPMSDFYSRSGLAMTALLGVLVEHMTEARSMPQVGYLIRTDYYYLTLYLLLFVLVTGLSVINLLVDKEKGKQAALWDKRFAAAYILATLAACAVVVADAVRLS